VSTTEVTIERSFGGYRLPDDAIDLEAWLRDGLAVYNLFVYMKPVFFQMLEAHGGEFRASWVKANEDKLVWRAGFREEEVGEPGEPGYDRAIVVTLERREAAEEPAA